eukprot:TRINITY_DN15057_c0_g1_i1.p1 TRINITY_DN15057_c0_g1~~TRINITY_DN15057_c0_g1_i1.p1  ORF type:complete len:100 (-),score=11.47 TRINITY_DN15057_c0_g1_i1:195-494(-)
MGAVLSICASKSCAICCTIFSLWGFLTLLVVGLCLTFGYTKIDEGQCEDPKSVGTQTIIAACIYLGFVVLCGVNWVFQGFKEGQQQRAINSRYYGEERQ